jgi:hypothetical protein
VSPGAVAARTRSLKFAFERTQGGSHEPVHASARDDLRDELWHGL